MSLKLVASNYDRALAIRDHLVPLIREHGRLQLQRDAVRLTVWQPDEWCFNRWTPFNELSSDEAASPGYRHALQRQRSRPDLAYGIEVWRGDRLLRLLWADDGSFLIDGFVRGPWEDEALAL